MRTNGRMNIGLKVTYKTKHKKEHGIIKSVSDKDHVFVVFNCDDNWDEYYNYTATRTRKSDLIFGWV